MTKAVGGFASWLTEKTETNEVILATEHGIASFKIVISANGKKTNVYSGFDTATWPWDEESDGLPTGSPLLWEHRYFAAQEKALKKYAPGQDPQIFPGRRLGEQFDALPADVRSALSDAIIGDEKVQAHWKMLSGSREPEASATGAKQGRPTTSSPPTVTPKPKVDRHAALMAADEGYGIF